MAAGRSARTAAAGMAAARIGLGAALVLAPGRMAAAWTGRDGDRPAARVFAAGLGSRDLAIGVGTAWGLLQGFGAGPWLWAGALTDAADCVAMLRARRSLPALRVAGAAAFAAGGALSGAWLARELD